MHEVVRSIEKWKPLRAPRLPSFAGSGLPERMRTTAFAFLGLTAAAGLALVAIFAQVSFHVLSPVPLPGEPVETGTVARAVAVDRAPALAQPRPAVVSSGGPTDGSGGSRQTGGEPATPQPPPPGVTAPSGGVSPEVSNPSASEPSSVPPASPSPTPEETSSPSAGAAPKPAPKPAPVPARPAAPAPAPAPAPGNSQSSAAAEHASDRGIEASSKQTASVEAPPATSSGSPPSADGGPGNGNGKALGHTK